MRIPFLPLLALLPAVPAGAQSTSVLFIGNSYTYVNDLPNTFRELALSLGDTVSVGISAVGGYTFEQHAEYAPTLAAIASQPWDYVVLQEQSQVPSFPPGIALTESLGSATELVQAIKANHECTLPVFYMTWGRADGDPDNCPSWPPVCTYDGMQGLLRERYLQMATDDYGCAAPVGVAWKRVRDTQPLINLYQSDNSHPTPAGTYLAACVFYSTLFHSSSVGASYNSTVDPVTAATLQSIASAVVLDSAATWRLDEPHGLAADAFFWAEGGPSSSFFTFIFHHPGQGQHWWSCSDGQTSTSADPTFVVTTPGDYTFTHIYTDLCGNSDTVTWTSTAWFESGLGIAPINGPDAAYRVSAMSSGTLDVTGGTGAEQFTLVDLQGRAVLARQLDGDHVLLPCPSGLYLWRIATKDGGLRTGKAVVP